MKIHEYQAKAILAEFGVPVPRGRVAAWPERPLRLALSQGSLVGPWWSRHRSMLAAEARGAG